MKILLIMDNPMIPTGYGSTCRLTAREFLQRGHEIYAFAFNGGETSNKIVEFEGIKIIPNEALKRNPNAIYGDLDLIKNTYKEIRPDILFWHNDSYRFGYLKDANLPEIFSKSVFWLPFEGLSPDVFGLYLFSKFAATRFVTKYALELHKDQLKNKNIGYIPHAIDSKAMVPCRDKIQSKIENIGPRFKAKGIQKDPSKTFIVTRVDRHQPRKLWDLTIKAFAEFAKNKDDVFLLGKCNPRDCTMFNSQTKTGLDLEELSRSLGIENKCCFDDYFFSPDFIARSFYYPADVFLTTTSGEGFGLALAEAMSCSVPVIYPNVPVLPEVVGDAGMMCNIDKKEWYEPLQVFHNIVDIKDVSNKLEEAYKDWKNGGKTLTSMGEKGVEKSKSYYPKLVYDQWDEVIKEIQYEQKMVSLITVLYNVSGEDYINGEDGIEKLRKTIEKYTSFPYEWIIVDNASPYKEITRNWLDKSSKENKKIKPIYLDVNLGFAGGNNVAIAIAKGKNILMVNPDCEAISPSKHGLKKDFIEIMYDKANSDPNIGIIGMSSNRRDDILTASLSPYYGCTMITKKCLDSLEMNKNEWLDESFWPAYYEDLDFSWRAMSKGFKIVELDIPFWHKSGGTNKHMIDESQRKNRMEELEKTVEILSKERPEMADWNRKLGEIRSGGMQSLISGNIAFLNNKWGRSSRSRIKVVWDTHIGSSVGFSSIAEGFIPILHDLGFDVYVNDWSNGSNITNPVIRQLYEKTMKAKLNGDNLDDAIHIVCWLMETFLDISSSYKVGISLCESTKVRESYLQACNSMDRILTFSEFCRGVQISSSYTSPINIIPPGVSKAFLSNVDKTSNPKKFSFLSVGVAQDRKDTRRLVEAFCEAFPKSSQYPPECDKNFPLKCSDIELVLKSNNFGDLSWVNEYKNRANIRTIFTGEDNRAERPNFSEEEMIDLYSSCDCLVHPSHGEGIGYPILEAAAMGMPVIFTNWSSPSEYLDNSNSYPCSLSPYPNTTFSKAYPGAPGENGLWANIHIGHMKFLMYDVVKNREEAIKKGKLAHDHVLKNFTFEESARYLAPLLFEWDLERKKKVVSEEFNPATYIQPTIEPVRQGDRIMIDCVTRDRHSYLATLCISLLGQTFKNWDIIIQIDDSDESVLRDHQIMSLMNRFSHEGHSWRMIRSHRQGPHIAHDRTLHMTSENPGKKYKLICRLDDDIYLKPDFLENLFDTFLSDDKCSIGAVGGSIIDPSRPDGEQLAPSEYIKNPDYAGKIDHNVPWPFVCLYPPGTQPIHVEHLYSSFMFRTEIGISIGGYCKQFSQIGHREESDFSHRFFLAGYKLLVNPKSIAFHFQAPSGGIRSKDIIDKNKLAISDHSIYERRLKKWKKLMNDNKNICKKSSDEVENNFPKVAIVINGSYDISITQKAIDRFAPWATELYAVSTESAILSHPKLKMIVTNQDDAAILTKALMSEGEHEYIMTVYDTTKFLGNPISILNNRYDDYVFEVFQSYDVTSKIPDDIAIGPEVRNECMIKRKNGNSIPSMEKTLFSDILVINDVKFKPVKGKSIADRDLIFLSQINEKEWNKICLYQYMEGSLNPPRMSKVTPTEKNLVSIIIPTPGRIQHLPRCIDSIFSNTSTPFEIIIIDNNSQDGTKEYLDSQEKIRPNIKSYRQPTNLGYQKAVNIAVSMAKGRYLLLFNDDAWVTSIEPDGRDWLRTLMDELESDSKIGLVGPHYGISPTLNKPMLFFWCVMMKRSTWDYVGPLDDVTFLNYGGDDDYCERIRMAGLTIKEKYVHLRHLMNLVPDKIKNPQLEESKVKLINKYGLSKT